MASEIGCCYRMPYKGYCILRGLKLYWFFPCCRTPQTLQLFLFSETWMSFDFPFVIVMGILVWFVQLSCLD